MNLKNIVQKASNGSLTKAELKEVHSALKSGKYDDYSLLLVIGRSGAREYIRDVECYLNNLADPFLTRLALQILCEYWGMATRYEKEIEEFIKKIDWDEDDAVRLMAIACVVPLYKEKENIDLLRLVYDVFKDNSEREIVRCAAYETLALISGKSVYELPQPAHFNHANDVEPWVIENINKMIS